MSTLTTTIVDTRREYLNCEVATTVLIVAGYKLSLSSTKTPSTTPQTRLGSTTRPSPVTTTCRSVASRYGDNFQSKDEPRHRIYIFRMRTAVAATVVSSQPLPAATCIAVEPDASVPVAHVEETTSGVPVARIEATSKWTSPLFACFDDLSICCFVCACPCCAFGQVMAAHFPELRSEDECLAYFCFDFCGCSVFYHSRRREKIRVKNQIPEGPCNDSCTTLFCGPAALCQEARQAKAMNPGTTNCLGM